MPPWKRKLLQTPKSCWSWNRDNAYRPTFRSQSEEKNISKNNLKREIMRSRSITFGCIHTDVFMVYSWLEVGLLKMNSKLSLDNNSVCSARLVNEVSPLSLGPNITHLVASIAHPSCILSSAQLTLAFSWFQRQFLHLGCIFRPFLILWSIKAV